MLFIETPVFTNRVEKLMDDDDYQQLQQSLADNPKQGALLQGGGGIRKVRWVRRGGGKSNGLRIIYYFAERQEQLWMLFIFGKNEMSNLSDSQLVRLRRIIERW